MSKEELKKYFEILELRSDASLREIKNSYLRLKKMYSSETTLLTPITIEFSKRKRQRILKQIEEAYTELIAFMKDEHSEPSSPEKTVASRHDFKDEQAERRQFKGEVLKEIRKKLGIQLSEVALDTKIQRELLKKIELEQFDDLPPPAYLKGHIMSYAKYLSLNPKKVARDYLIRYNVWKKETKEKG